MKMRLMMDDPWLSYILMVLTLLLTVGVVYAANAALHYKSHEFYLHTPGENSKVIRVELTPGNELRVWHGDTLESMQFTGMRENFCEGEWE